MTLFKLKVSLQLGLYMKILNLRTISNTISPLKQIDVIVRVWFSVQIAATLILKQIQQYNTKGF